MKHQPLNVEREFHTYNPEVQARAYALSIFCLQSKRWWHNGQPSPNRTKKHTGPNEVIKQFTQRR